METFAGRAGPGILKEAPGSAVGKFGRFEIIATAFFSISHQEVVSISSPLESGLALLCALVN